MIIKGKILREDLALYDGINTRETRRDSTGGTIQGNRVGGQVDVMVVYGPDRHRSSIVRAMTAIGNHNVTLNFTPGIWEIDIDLTIPDNFTCYIHAGAVFYVATGKTLTFSGPVVRESGTWTSGPGTVSYTPSNNVIAHQDDLASTDSGKGSYLNANSVNVSNIVSYGAVSDTSGAAATNRSSIQAAIDASVQTSYDAGVDYRAMASRRAVYLPAGVYYIDDVLTTPNNAQGGTITIYGDNTILVQTNVSAAHFMVELPTRVKFVGIQFHSGTSAVEVDSDNLDNSTLEFFDCGFQGQTDYPIKCLGTNMPKTLIVKYCNFVDTCGGIYSACNQTAIEENWFEFVHTNPLLYNIAQSVFNNNRIVPGTFLPGKSKPTYYLVNDGGQLWAKENISSGENNTASQFCHITGDATLTHIQQNISITDSDYNITIDCFPINVSILHNWFAENGGVVINDDYLTDLPDSAVAGLTRTNVVSGNVLGSGYSKLFANEGAYFTVDQRGSGRAPWEYERSSVDVESNFANLFPFASEAWGTASSGSGTSVTDNYDVAPDGTSTAMRITSTVGGARAFNFATGDIGASGNYVFSCWVRNVAGNNAIAVRNVTDNITLNIVYPQPTALADWVRLSIPFYFDSAKTYSVQWSMAATSDMVVWGRQINRGKAPAPYLYKSTNAKASLFPIVGVERPVLYASAIPSAGDYKVGTIVFNTGGALDGNNLLTLGWYRLTTGSSHTSGTDWAVMRVSHVSPAT